MIRSNKETRARATLANAPVHVDAHDLVLLAATQENNREITASLCEAGMSVSQEHRCSRGGGYRSQAK